MSSITSLLVALSLLDVPADAVWPPKTTFAELNAMVKTGNYHLVRKQKLALQVEDVGVVRLVGKWTLLTVPEHWSVHLLNVPADHSLKTGDRVRFRGLILNEAYEGLMLWTYSWAKEPAPAERSADKRP